jgi:hypothetical protein
MIIPLVLSQRTYPGAGDIDDCWVVATVWAAVASVPSIWQPSVTTFRKYAGDPDDGISDGGSIDECFKGAKGCWPGLDSTLWKANEFSGFLSLVKAGRPASVALDSAALPSRLRFGFMGKHQVGIVWDGTKLLCANPLAAQGSRPLTITEAELKTAMSRLVFPAAFRAVVFPKPAAPKPVPHWAAEIAPDIKKAYTSTAVAAKLRSLGVTSYGDALNYSDLEAGLRKRGINYGTSVQLIDVRALMRPGTGR